MSLTEADQVFAGVHERALNDLLTAVCRSRPRYLKYGSPAFVPATSVDATAMPAIDFPGLPGGIQWLVRLTIPRVDCYEQSSPLPTELQLAPGQFSIKLGVELCVDCGQKAQPITHVDPAVPTCCALEVAGVGHPVATTTSDGQAAVALAVDAIEIADIAPDALETVLECIILRVVQAAVAQMRLPVRALRAGAFQLALTYGPVIEDNQIKVRGNI